MDNFTVAVIIGDALMCLSFLVLILIDKPQPAGPAETPKPAGKRPA